MGLDLGFGVGVFVRYLFGWSLFGGGAVLGAFYCCTGYYDPFAIFGSSTCSFFMLGYGSIWEDYWFGTLIVSSGTGLAGTELTGTGFAGMGSIPNGYS